MPSKKAKLSWPCGVCKSECVENCVHCECCRKWFHAECEHLTNSDLKAISDDRRRRKQQQDAFVCFSCFQQEIGKDYCFSQALLRLNMASRHGYDMLKIAAAREMRLIPELKGFYIHHKLEGLRIDHYTEGALRASKMLENGRVVHATGDGNCFFNALSLSVCGNESMARELRVRTCLELVCNEAIHSRIPHSSELHILYGSYKNACISAATDCSWTSMCGIIAAAHAISTTIRSIYPPMNGTRDLAYRRLNLRIDPNDVKEDADSEIIKIVWTKMGWGKTIGTWCPNHFSAIITPVEQEDKEIPSLQTVQPEQRREKDRFPEGKLPTNEDNGTRDNKCVSQRDIEHSKYNTSELDTTEDIMQFEIPTAQSTPIMRNNNSEFEERSTETVSVSSIGDSFRGKIDMHTEEVDSLGNSNILPGHWLDVDKVFTLLKTANGDDIKSEIPHGNKSNQYFLVDFSTNIERFKKQNRCSYFDDCGIWDSKKGTTANLSYMLENDKLKLVYLKNGVYCIRKQENKRKVFVPISPQPSQGEIVKIHRSYSVLKADSKFQKRVTYMIEGCNDVPNNVALVEYLGEFSNVVQPHGNSRKNINEYIRTNPKTMDKIADEVHSKKPRKVYFEMVKDDSINAPRNFKQVRDKKYAEKKKQKINRNINIADDIVEGIEMVDTSEIVQEVLLTKGQSPSFILYTNSQLLDLKYFLSVCEKEGATLGIDRTFNLGPFFVTAFVYKNLRLTRHENEKVNPLFLGPMLLHRSARCKDYHAFLSHVKIAVATTVSAIDVRIPKNIPIGSDDEKALTNAIDSVFPSATRTLCTKHMKDNVSDYLQNKVGVPVKERRDILSKLFGETGLVSADDTFNFEELSEEIRTTLTKYPNFGNYFEKIKERIHNYVVQPRKLLSAQKRNVLWTNNNCESINHIMKLEIDWAPENTKGLIDKLHNIVKLHFLDFKRAMYGNGNYRLKQQLIGKYHVPKDKWRQMSIQEKDAVFQDFLKDVKKCKRKETSSEVVPGLKVPSTPRVARKPGQRKRPRAERSNPKPK